jgi:hypothetical protein
MPMHPDRRDQTVISKSIPLTAGQEDKRMKRAKVGALVAMAFAAALAVMPAKAETVKKLHTAVQRIINVTGTLNDVTDATTGVSTTVDLAGGDYDKCSFAVSASSAAGGGSASLALQISPDGGTTWIATGDTIAVATSTTLGAAVTAHADNFAVSPGTKLRIIPTLSSSTSYYGLKVWALPSVD